MIKIKNGLTIKNKVSKSRRTKSRTLRRFKVVIEPEVDGGFSIHVPALRGCASQGETVKEALGNIKEAISLYLLSLQDDNLPIPKSDVRVELREVKVSL